ncbi:hypothetical protein [Agaribacterium haliotis]|uniref:hypothetical protein n=1 Tax=Agaribacterium haliotis TaxID=2013869 RepID=UPI000BB554D5|nr:hypothetical protein [Agaribacterium haliotis]
MPEPNLILITLSAVAGACGLALAFVGTLMAMLMALGKKQWLWGIACFFPPLPSLVYSFIYRRENNYAWQLLASGYALIIVFVLLMSWELSRLGLSFAEVMASTRPVH